MQHLRAIALNEDVQDIRSSKLRKIITADSTLKRFMDRRLESNDVSIEGVVVRAVTRRFNVAIDYLVILSSIANEDIRSIDPFSPHLDPIPA